MIKPIETVYNGYLFRSRLEARWAVFFDALGIGYEYEPEGFDIDGIWYLPDFLLHPDRPDIYVPPMYVEIKPRTFEPSPREKNAFGGMADAGHMLTLISGQPYGDFRAIGYFDGEEFEYTTTIFDPQDIFEGPMYFLEGRRTGIIAFESEFCYGYGDEERLGWVGPRICIAYTAARQARFEHGEAPRL